MEVRSFTVLAINPGSTSTKTSIFKDEEELASSVIRHGRDDFAGCSNLLDQMDIRMAQVNRMLEEHSIQTNELDAVVGRGGLIRPISSGTYEVNENMAADLSTGWASSHASSLGGLMAREIAVKNSIPAFIVDPVVVDELEPIARISGIPGIKRRSIFHALNAKSVARLCAAELGKRYEDCRLVVAHMGGGISVGAHRYGRVIDVNDALCGEGPFSPERCGGLPVEQVVNLCFSGDYSKRDVTAFATKTGGMAAYLGVCDLRVAEEMIAGGDDNARLVVDAMAYQVSKEIGAMASVLEFDVDRIALTGGLAYSKRFTGIIEGSVGRISGVSIYPGEDEMRALAMGALRVLRGEEKAAVY
ncbi:MAG: butyrate kinase [Synergistaceae bacterium]|nr:butyrate kinase [Synergistaceae bacterium]